MLGILVDIAGRWIFKFTLHVVLLLPLQRVKFELPKTNSREYGAQRQAREEACAEEEQ
jgi:hypothetical protein